MKKFKIDDRVKINPKSEYNYQAPNGMEGTIIECEEDEDDDDYAYRVRWDNGDKNTYRNKDILLTSGFESQYEIY